MRLRSVILTAGFVLGASAGHVQSALAVWSATGVGPAGAAATTMPTGSAPTAAATGSSVTVRWASAQLGSGTSVTGYVVHRYDTNGNSFAVGGTCAGTVTTTACTETVGSGTWFYTDTPVQASWTGGESPRSNSASTP